MRLSVLVSSEILDQKVCRDALVGSFPTAETKKKKIFVTLTGKPYVLCNTQRNLSRAAPSSPVQELLPSATVSKQAMWLLSSLISVGYL